MAKEEINTRENLIVDKIKKGEWIFLSEKIQKIAFNTFCHVISYKDSTLEWYTQRETKTPFLVELYTEKAILIPKEYVFDKEGYHLVDFKLHLPIKMFFSLVYGFYDYDEFSQRNECDHIKRDTEQVSHPSHYKWLKDLCGVEPIDICRHLDFNIGCAVKYLLRKGKREMNLSDKEQRIQDLKKAAFYIQDEIKLLSDGKWL